MIIEAPDDTTLEHARDMETALRRLSRLTEKLMQLARAEGGRLLAEKPIDIAVILRMVVSEFGEHTPGAGRVELMLSDNPVSANIDPDAFAVLARNLIENALKHGDPKEPVSVALSADGILQVANAGPAVPAQTLARLSEPFERGSSQADGAGLGLAIAKTIAAGTGGRLDLISPIEGGRTVSRPYFPLASNSATSSLLPLPDTAKACTPRNECLCRPSGSVSTTRCPTSSSVAYRHRHRSVRPLRQRPPASPDRI